MTETRRWRVKIGARTQITRADLPPGIVSEVSELHGGDTWWVVMTADRQHLPGLLSRALAWPGFSTFDVWRSAPVNGEFPQAVTA